MADSSLEALRAFPRTVAGAVLNSIELPMRALQRALGVPRIGWVFVTPNLVVLGLFTFLPIVIDFYYAFTGGGQLYPTQRPFTGLDNLQTLFDCDRYFDPSSCRIDLFWRAVFNTAWFALLQVGLMVLFALVTALVLNRKIIGRGFFRGVFFYPVLLSPVVVALIWKWILQREGLLNALLQGAGVAGPVWLNDAGWAFFWSVFVSIWAHMGFFTLILLAGLQAIPADLYEAAEMDNATPCSVRASLSHRSSSRGSASGPSIFRRDPRSGSTSGMARRWQRVSCSSHRRRSNAYRCSCLQVR